MMYLPTHKLTSNYKTRTQCQEDTCYCEDAKMAAPPDFVLAQEEGEEHEQTPIMHHPPDVNVPLHPVHITRIPVDTLGHQNSQLTTRGNPNRLCVRVCKNIVRLAENTEPLSVPAAPPHSLTYEHTPGGSPPPTVRPGNNDGVVPHPSKTSSLDAG